MLQTSANIYYIHTLLIVRNSSIRNFYSTFYPITIEIQQAIYLLAIENKRKIEKLSILRLDLKKMCVTGFVCIIFFQAFSIQDLTVFNSFIDMIFSTLSQSINMPNGKKFKCAVIVSVISIIVCVKILGIKFINRWWFSITYQIFIV